MVASAVMALAIAVGGFGTTALLASQPAGLTVEPSALLWEGETDAAHSTKKETETGERMNGYAPETKVYAHNSMHG